MEEKNEDKKIVEEEPKVVITEKEDKKEEKVKIIYKEKEKSLFSRVINIVLWVVLLSWMAVCLYDFYRVTTEKEPVFCIKNETTAYEDGNVETCLGLGYKVFNYNRASYTAIEFGPFWAKDRTNK